MIRAAEEDAGIKVLRDGFVMGELFSVVKGDRAHLLFIECKQGNNGIGYLVSIFAWDGSNERDSAGSFDQRNEGSLVGFADNGVSFPVSGLLAVVSVNGSLLNAGAVRYLTA